MTTSRLFAAAGLAAGLLLAAGVSDAADKKKEAAKKALADEAGDLIGVWKGLGKGKGGNWKETFDWGWKFGKDGDAWLALNVENGKHTKGGSLKYDPDKKQFVVTAVTADGQELVYAGKFIRGKLTAERTDPATKDVYQLTMYTLSDGARMVVKVDKKAGGKGLASNEYTVEGSKEGESFAGGGGKKNECIVTGGSATIQVSYNGKTYFVCCSGCRDEFNADPKKYVDEFEKKKK